MKKKNYMENNVYNESCKRLEYIFKEFGRDVYLSFSGGKDSGVMLNLSLNVARKMDLLPLKVFFIDMEAQYKETIDYISETFKNTELEPYWLCLPISLRNAVSVFSPKWIPWDKNKKELWIRELPSNPNIITEDNIPEEWTWFKKGMEFEELTLYFGEWLAKKSENNRVACLVGIRSDESLKRFSTISREVKSYYKDDIQWSTKVNMVKSTNLYNFYPIYDWRVEDIWAAVGKFNFLYNRVYDLFFYHGESINTMRLCQPYGDNQRKSLNLFHEIEPETWFKIVRRVSGANFGAIYRGNKILGNREALVPEGYTYKEYTLFLLESMPKYLKMHYLKKINTFLKWWHKKLGGINFEYEDSGFFKTDLVEEIADKKLEAQRKAPSWRRICKVILRNDFYCYGLSFCQNKNEYEKLMKLKKIYGE